MKKSSILALSLCIAFGAAAQTTLVKDAQKSFKAGQNYDEWLKTVQPAFTNPETATAAFTYFVPAQKGYENFDHLLVLARAGQQIDFPNMGESIIKGYEYALKALPLDSVPDEKGKIKPKYSKDLVNMITSHYNDYDMAARFLYNAKDWSKAADAWDIYFDVVENPAFAKKIKVDPDSLLAENAGLQAFVVSQTEDFARAEKLFDRAIALGNKVPSIYQTAMYVARMNKNQDKMYQIAEKAYEKFGTANPIFFQVTVEGKLRNKDYAAAKTLLDEGLAREPQNPVYNVAMGQLVEEQGDKDGALKYYELATQYDPNSSNAWMNVGRVYAEQSDAIAEGMGANISENEFHRVEREQINPLRRKAAEAFEKAYAIDEAPGSLQYLKNIYYVLGDNANFERVNKLF